MANSKQIKSLVLAHFDKDGEKFRTTVLQIAANEAKNGHTKFAKELKDIIQNSKRNSLRRENISNDQLELLQFSIPNTKLSELVVNDNLRNRIKRIIKENKQKENLLSYGLQSRRKILIEGPSGTGKTMTSRIIASELNYPLYTIQMDKLVTKFMGETSIKLRQIFDIIAENELSHNWKRQKKRKIFQISMCLFSFLCQSAPETAEEKQPDRPQPIKNSRFAKKRNF